MKLKKIGKKSIALSLVAIVSISMIGIGAVITNGGLSNEVQAEMETTQAIELSISRDNGNSGWQSDDHILFTDVHSGETRTFWIKTENHADATIIGYPNITVTCDQGLGWNGETLLDFKYANGSTWENGQYNGPWNLIDSESYKKLSWNKVCFYYGPPNGPDGHPQVEFTPGMTQVDKIEVTFADNAYGDYTVDIQVMPIPN